MDDHASVRGGARAVDVAAGLVRVRTNLREIAVAVRSCATYNQDTGLRCCGS